MFMGLERMIMEDCFIWLKLCVDYCCVFFMKMESLFFVLFVLDNLLIYLFFFCFGVGYLLYQINCFCLSYYNKYLFYQNCFFFRNYDMYYFFYIGIDKYNYNNSKN